eukprot:scaffold72706_cov52-Attheya_sp.AAC.5
MRLPNTTFTILRMSDVLDPPAVNCVYAATDADVVSSGTNNFERNASSKQKTAGTCNKCSAMSK